jgi:protocatechuate 3,4-dioxygenase beta subunit
MSRGNRRGALLASGCLLLLLRAASGVSAGAEGRGIVTGRVVNAKTGTPVRKASVAIAAADGRDAAPLDATTDAEGRFTFQVEPGRYRVAARHDGFAPAQYSAAGDPATGGTLTVKAEETREVLIKAVPLCAISGRVLDEDGDPVEGALVSAIRDASTGGRRDIERASRVTTNDLGEYRLYDLPAGRYYVGASVQGRRHGGGRSGDSTMTYYPYATDLNGAAPLELTPGTTLANIDLVAGHVAKVSVLGAILNPPPGQPVIVSLLPPDTGLSVKFVRKEAEYHPETGRFEIHGVAPGAYVLAASASIGERLFSARQLVSVREAPLRDLRVALSPGGDLDGEIQVEPRSSLALPPLTIALTSRDQGGGAGSVRPDGSFTIPNVVPNAYALRVSGLTPPWYLKSVSLAGHEVSPFDIDLSGGAPGTLTVVVGAAAGQLAGTVLSEQQPTAGALVVLIPSERERADLYKTTETTQDGAFALEAIAPGQYTLFATQGVDPGAFHSPEFLTRVEEKGQPVTIAESSRQSVLLKLIPEQDLSE